MGVSIKEMNAIQVKALQMQQTVEDRDTERALQLFNAPTLERSAALARLREAIKAGDIDAMRAAFQGKNGFIIGTGALHGYTERLVITEVLRLETSTRSLELLSVFFKELGGRFMVDERYDVCVFSMLIEIEGTKYIHDAEEAERWTLRLAEVVRHLVEKLEYPIHMTVSYSVRPVSRSAPLMDLVLQSGAWACYMAFAQFIRPAPVLSLLQFVVQDKVGGVRSGYWVKRFAAAVEDEESLWNCLQLPDIIPEHVALIHAEGEGRIQHKQALLLLQDQKSDNAAWQRAVMGDPNLSRMILTLAFEHRPFNRQV
jgi:hypothetical protein